MNLIKVGNRAVPDIWQIRYYPDGYRLLVYPETYEKVNRYSKTCEHVNCQQDYRTLALNKGIRIYE